MFPDIASLVSRKYNIQQQEADARTTQTGAEAKLALANTAAVPIRTAADAAFQQAQAAHLNEQSKYVGLQAQSAAGLQGSQADYYGSHAALNKADLMPDHNLNAAIAALHGEMRQYWQPNGGLPGYNQSQGQGSAAEAGATSAGLPNAATQQASIDGRSQTLANPPQSVSNASTSGGYNHSNTNNAYSDFADLPHLAAGGMVPGQGSGAVDSVPAVLAPHEAVLNAGAAQHVGPHLIDVLNALGAHKMAMEGRAPQQQPGQEPPAKAGKGMPAPKGKKGPVKAASGTADVGGPGLQNGSYDAYVRALQTQDPNSTANVVADARAKLTGGSATPRPQAR